VPRAVLGIGKKLEVRVNVAVVDAFAPEQSIYISPNVKPTAMKKMVLPWQPVGCCTRPLHTELGLTLMGLSMRS
jgi:hypothetical protein